eukprot:1179457-Prymnesium_polylepis.1
MQVDGADCGYLSPPDVACSEICAAYWTGRCAGRVGGSLARCLEWHARWATQSCYPDDEHLEAHVRWARQRCDARAGPAPEDAHLVAANRSGE